MPPPLLRRSTVCEVIVSKSMPCVAEMDVDPIGLFIFLTEREPTDEMTMFVGENSRWTLNTVPSRNGFFMFREMSLTSNWMVGVPLRIASISSM